MKKRRALLALRSSADKADLQDFAAAYMECQEKNGRPPNSADELKPFLERKSSRLQDRVRSGELLVIWGAQVGANGFDGQRRGFAFIKTGKKNKLATLFQDGSIRDLTEGELLSSEKARLPEKP